MDDRTALRRAAARLGRTGGGAKALPGLLAFTDPHRSGDLLALAARLPRGAALVYRAFGAAEAEAVAWKLRRITWRRGVLLLIGADPALARRVRANGIHLPERLAGQLPRLKGRMLLTAAAHSPAAARRAFQAGADAVVVSPVAASESVSAGRPMGVLKLAGLTARLRGPVYAMGGIDGNNARRIAAAGVAGLAAVGVWAQRP